MERVPPPPVTPKEFSVDNLNYGSPQKEGGHHRSPVIYGDSNSSLVLQSAPLKLLKISANALELEITDKSTNRSKQFYHALVQLELHAIKTIHENSQHWFGKTIPVDKIKQMYRSCVYPPLSMNGDVIIRLKITRDVRVFNENKDMITIEDLNEMDKDTIRLSCLCRIDGLLFGRNATKLDIKITQIKVSYRKPKEVAPPPPVEKEEEVIDEEHEKDSVIDDDDEDAFSINPSMVEPTINDEDVKEIKLEPETSQEDNKKSLIEEELRAELSLKMNQMRELFATENADEQRIEDLSCEISALKQQIKNL